MNDVQALLSRCQAYGAELIPMPSGKLKVRAPAPLPEDMQEELRERKKEILALLTASSYRDAYRQAAKAIEEDCFSIDPEWLIENRPILWKRMVWLDELATKAEQDGKPEEDYRSILESLVALVKEAREAYERACSKKMAINQ